MENTLEKVFINRHLGIKFKSYIDEDCNVWFKAKEVATILGYKNTVDVIKRHVSESNKIENVQQRETRGYLLQNSFASGYLLRYYHL